MRVGQRQRRAIDFRAADHHDIAASQRLFQRACAIGAFGLPVRIARHHDIARARAAAFCGSESQVLRPITTVLPRVSALKRFRSSEICQGIAPSLPMTPLLGHRQDQTCSCALIFFSASPSSR